jgi:hypothetical protein
LVSFVNKKRTLSEGSIDVSIPVSVLSDRSVATLESVVEYMKDTLGLTYHQIAILLKRDDRTIWTCYNRAKKKREHEKQ